MRILVVSNLYPPVTVGGYEACCGAVVEHLRERHDVRVLTSSRRAHEVPLEPWIWRRLPLFNAVSGDTATAVLVTRRAIREARRALLEFAPEMVFVWAAAAIPKGAIRVLEASGVPLAFSILDYWFDLPYEHDPYMRYLHRGETGVRAAWSVLMRLCNLLPSLRVDLEGSTPTAVSWCSNALRSLTSVSPTLDVVLEQTVPLATFHEATLATLEHKPRRRPTIVFVGRLSREKGPDVAIRALAALSRDHEIDADLQFCGAPAAGLERELEDLSNALGVSGRVRMLGALESGPLAEVLAGAHAVIIPSSWEEPFGLVCLEGALARVPVVASRSGGLGEILLDEEHALFFPIGDAGAAAAAIARVLRQPDETAARVARAFLRARELSMARYLADSEAFVERAHAILSSSAVSPALASLR